MILTARSESNLRIIYNLSYLRELKQAMNMSNPIEHLV
jgi:hypothetical protein